MNHDAVRAPQGAAGWTPADDSEVQGGARVTIAVSKTDQTGEGRHGRRADGPDAVAWLRRWLAASGIDRGPIFRMVAADGSVRSGALAPQVDGSGERCGKWRRSAQLSGLRNGTAVASRSPRARVRPRPRSHGAGEPGEVVLASR